MSEARILVIEDDADINEVVCTQLTKAGYDCTPAYSGSEARLLLEREMFDCIITDLMLPGVPGDRLISELRETGTGVPIIVISARDTVADRVSMLKLGADDYLVKPFDLDELVVRVQAQLRGRSYSIAAGNDSQYPSLTRELSAKQVGNPDSVIDDALYRPPLTRGLSAEPTGGETAATAPILTAARWTLNCAARTFTIDNQPVALTNIEFNIIELLMAHPNTVFTKQQMYELCWGEPYMVDENTVTAHVSKIRAKLKPSGTDTYITTVWGLGFKLGV